jgi:hypothetical protein
VTSMGLAVDLGVVVPPPQCSPCTSSPDAPASSMRDSADPKVIGVEPAGARAGYIAAAGPGVPKVPSNVLAPACQG